MKKHKPLSLAVSILVLTQLLVSVLPSQTKREVLTNAKIVEMVQAGWGEGLIVEKIRQSDCQCDTTTGGINKLKTAKVTDKIIIAMMESRTGYSESQPDNSNKTNPVDVKINVNGGSPAEIEGEKALMQISEPGIYLFEDGKMTLIEPTVYNGTKANMLGTIFTYGIKKTKIRAVVRGKSANTQIMSSRPVFYFIFSREYGNAGAVMSGFGGYSATSPAEFMMISMKVKESSREATLGEVGAFSQSTGASDKDIREYTFDKVKPGIYKVTPKIDLSTGEYCFYYAGNGGAGSKVFDFSVRK